MIQIYNVHNYVSINGKEWCEVKTYLGNDWMIIYDEEDAVGGMVLDNVSFDCAYAYIRSFKICLSRLSPQTPESILNTILHLQFCILVSRNK